MIIVGDHTPDAAAIRAYIASIADIRISFIDLPTRAGIASPGTIPKKAGVARSSGELLCFLDPDNLFTPGHLQYCHAAFILKPELDLVYSDSLIKISGPASLINTVTAFIWKKPGWSDFWRKRLLSANFLDMSETVFRRETYVRAGGLDAASQSSDWQLWRQMILAGHHNFQHLERVGLIYHTSDLGHHLLFWFLMMAQKSRIPYKSDWLKFMRRILERHFKRKHG